MKYLILLLLFGCSMHTFGQVKKKNDPKKNPPVVKIKRPDTVYCDCEKARIINLKYTSVVGPTIAPYGPGKEEFKNPHFKNHKIFEKEHFSAWYKINMLTTGKLSFTIRPIEKKDDYDFILYKAEDTSFCRNFQKLNAKPLRSDICRGDTAIAGTTGLIKEAPHEFEHEGKAPAWVKSIDVQKGETYYLVLDNVYENGKGHSIEFFIKDEVEYKGCVTNEKGVPLSANVSITDEKGIEVSKTRSDLKTGKYVLPVELLPGKKYKITYTNDSAFAVSFIMPADSFHVNKNSCVQLECLSTGESIRLKNINFYGNSSEILPGSNEGLERLLKFMLLNAKLKIQLEGHVNGCGGSIEPQRLSRERAESIMNWLIMKGVKSERMKAVGYGCSQMLYPDPRNDAESEANRRVEVRVLEK